MDLEIKQNIRSESVQDWYEQYHSTLFSYALTKLHSSELADDCVQDVFQIAIEKADTLRSHENIGGWLMRTLQNRIALYFRKEAAKLHAYAAIPVQDSTRVLFDDDLISDAEILGMKERLIGSFSPKEARLYALFYEEHRKIKEIAAQEATTEAAIKMRLVRLRNKIYDRMNGFFI